MHSYKYYIKKIFTYLKSPLKIKFLLFLMDNGYLYEKGWLNSLIKKEIIDKNNEPIPWLSYPAIDFINEVIPKTASVFEFGAGNSTIYFCQRYQSVISVENDHNWYQKVVEEVSSFNNCEVIFAPDRNYYVQSIAKTNSLFDLIVIDGRWRKACLIESIKHLKQGGYIILDDADRDFYKPAINVIKEAGYFSLNFNGMSAGSFDNHSTMIFWRKD